MKAEKKLKQFMLFKIYMRIFRWTANKRLAAQDLDTSVIHTHLLTVLTTGILMWGYAIVAHLYIDSWVPALVGYVCAFVHVMTPLLFKINKNKYLISGVMLGAGITHQATFSFYSGGFTSDIIIWFGIIPMLAGLIAGRYAVIFWSLIALSITSTYLYLELVSWFQFPDLISDEGRLVAHAMIAFGWIFLSLITGYFYILIRDITTERLQVSSDKINTLLRVLCHDLANLLHIVLSYSSVIEKLEDESKRKMALEKIYKSANGMNDVIKNVKYLYKINEDENEELKLSSVSLQDAFDYAYSILEDKIQSKKIKVIKNIPEDLSVCVDETSFKHQVILNLYSNAIKFSHENSEVVINARKSGDGRVLVEFQDFGVGMNERAKDRLFDPTVISTTRGTNGEKGTGFGMSIMNSFVEKYGGSVRVDSIEGEGTKFTLSLR